jgi:hypothetical protein
MRIQFERSGGLMGMRMTAHFDTSHLPQEDATELEDMIHSAAFFDLPANLQNSAGADQFEYRLTVERPDPADPATEQTHTVQVGETTAPPEMQLLLRKLTLLARSQT